MKFKLYKLTILNIKDFMKKSSLKKDTMDEFDTYPIHPRNSKKISDKVFIKIDDGSMGETDWCCFYIVENKSFYFDSFGGSPDKFLLEQLPKPILYHNYKIQDMNSRIFASYCLYFFYLIERMNYYDTIS